MIPLIFLVPSLILGSLGSIAIGSTLGWMHNHGTQMKSSQVALRNEITQLRKEVRNATVKVIIQQAAALYNSSSTPSSTTTTISPMARVVMERYREPNQFVYAKAPPRRRTRNRQKREAGAGPWSKPIADTGKVYLQLSDDASVDAQMNDTKYETRVLESGIIAPTAGLVMEQTGSYMEFSGFLYVPIIYHMPHLIELNLIGSGTNCNITVNPEHQKMIISLLKNKIGDLIPERHRHRSKRFIETLILGGAVAWNRASIWSLQDTTDALDKQLHTMQDQQHVVTESINTMIDNQHAIHHAVDRQARILRELTERTDCSDLITNYFREVYATWLALAPNDFARVVDSALSGKITPDLLPANDVVDVLLRHPTMVNTAYSQDLTLLYELGKLSLHRVSFEPYPMVSGVMIFPRILMDRSAAMMRIHTTHMKTSKGYRKLKLPDAVACKSKDTCWEISPTTCRELLTLTLCPKVVRPDFNTCLNRLLSNTSPSSSCEWSLSKDPSMEVITFDGGVLVSATSTSGEIMITQGQELVVHAMLEPSDSPTVLTSLEGDYLHIGGQIYQLRQETIKTGYDININITLPEQRESLEGLSVEGWTDESHIEHLRSEPWVPPTHYTWWGVVGIICVLLILCIIIIRYRFQIQRLHARVKDEVSGWLTVPSAPPRYDHTTREALSGTNFVV